MDRKTYSRTYNESKQQLRDAIRKFEQENPEKYAALQVRAKYELDHPPKPRIVTRYPSQLRFNVDDFIRQHHTQDFYIHTKDAFSDTHLYFHSLNDETAESVLARLHPKFVERNETVTKVEKCLCPLCTSTQSS